MVKRTRTVADAESVQLKSTRPSRNQNDRQKRAKQLDQSKFNDEDAKQALGRQHANQESRLQKNRDTSESKESNANVQNESRPSELPSTKMAVVEKVGDLFDAPDNAILIHACNCIGSWGAGIAAAFKTRYPEAFIGYRQHCRSNEIENLNGSALLIPPLEEDGPKHFIGCLFTSKRPGKARDSPEDILQNTETAMIDLMYQIALKPEISEIRMCHINSGLFNVPWESTKSLIEKLDFEDEDVPRTISAWVPASNS
jgi:ADP-ribose 1''-phosphate phosphatase